MDEPTEQEWAEAKEQFDYVFGFYKDLLGGAIGVQVLPAITIVFEPLARRYNGGERSRGLYEEMLAVE